ncbi:peptidylprolyl isomerase, partial [Candidatus Pelagibacter sp.]|nr:peptidylprolyl isomerase [Candidatus Pelagibacter sp.]
MFKKKFLLFLGLIFLIFNTNSYSIENKILVKIENEIITSLDVYNEYKYLVALNPNIKNSKKDDVLKFSKKSLLQEKIKKIEIEKNFNNPKIPQKFVEQILKNVYSRIGLNNLDDFKKYLTNQNIDFKNVKNKLEIEALWNELILIKFSSKVKINEEELRKRIQDNNKFLKSYLLSEISFEVSNLKELENKYQEISKVINNKGFDFAALQYSISPTSNLGGKLDWINENSLNKDIRLAIKNLEINDFTKPINVPGGFLILHINDIKNSKIEIDIEKEFKLLENYEKNNQLNQ